jgi:23S rRNA U2552 (ribose-2'-O)-methylase RlmE/FtsJ
MINDTVDIIDPFIINLGVNFVVSSKDGVNKFDLNERCVTALSEKFGSAFYIGEDINISDMYKELSMVRGVHEVVSVKLVNRTG